MKVKLIILSIAFIILGVSQNYAQNSSSPKRKTVSKPVDYIFILQIAANSNITLSVQESEEIDNIGSVSNTNALVDFFSLLSDSKKRKINPTIIVKADPGLNYGIIVDFLKKIGKASDDRVKLEISKNLSDPFVLIPSEPKSNSKKVPKPNPNTLVVEITSDRKITLNNEPEDTLNDLSKLKKHLAEIFKEREDNGVFRENTNEIEKTVFVKADRSLQFSEIIQLVNAIKETGATPVGLQVDDLTENNLFL